MLFGEFLAGSFSALPKPTFASKRIYFFIFFVCKTVRRGSQGGREADGRDSLAGGFDVTFHKAGFGANRLCSEKVNESSDYNWNCAIWTLVSTWWAHVE